MENVHRSQRKNPRLKHYDYSQPGGYFVTICTHERRYVFGKIENGHMIFSPFGRLVENVVIGLPKFISGLTVDTFQLMPDHLHAIFFLSGDGVSLIQLVQRLKSYVATIYREFDDKRLWQRGYFEHVIRNDRDLHLVREYILNNPLQWELDRFIHR